MTRRNDPPRGEAFVRQVEETKVPQGSLAIWFMGQESVIVKGNATLYFDPYVSDYLEKEHGAVRAYPSPIVPEHITNADYYFITHEHADHLDEGTVPVVARQSPETVFVAPAACRAQLLELGVRADRLIDAQTDVWTDAGSGKGSFRFKALPAAHELLDEDPLLGHRYVGYVVEMNGVILYHAGDTTIYPGLLERLQNERIDVGMLPINGRDAFRNQRGLVGNMDYREAAELAYLADFEYVIPLHYDVFAGNSEHPGYFVDYLYDHYPEQKFHILARSERFLYVKMWS